ncbi:MAG: DNA internalization-related competence protein ComEC/Rec2 [Phycisphaerae bacterium]|jgi:competence protein ComEC
MDDIQRKLELIDEQLKGGFGYYHKQIISTAPLLFAAAGLIAGILIQDVFGLAVWFWLVFVGVCTAVTVILYVVYRDKKERLPYILAYAALICFFCLGAIRLSSYEQPASNDIRNFVIDERILATIRGSIISKPYVNKNEGWEFVRFTHKDPTSSFYLELGEVETVDGWAKVSGTVRVQVDEPVLGLKAGDYIQTYCWLGRFEKAANPGQFDVAEYLARKNIFVAASVDSRDAIEMLQSGSTDFFVKIKRKAREIAVQSLLGGAYPQDESERLLQALVLGYRTEMDTATFEAFRRTGLLHFVCLSGMNFGIFIGMIWWLCKTAGLTRKPQAAVCIIATAMFVLVVPPNPPAFRAAIICIVFCLSFFFRRRPSHFNSLALAAIVILMIKPTDLFDVSWQLSFASVMGILLFCQRILFFLYEKITGHSWFDDLLKTRPIFQIVPRPGPSALQLFSTSLAAWLASSGILLYNFYVIQPLTSIWTVIASPLIAVISFLGYLKLLVGVALPTAASMLDWGIKPLSRCLIWLVKCMAQIDFSQVLIGHITIWPIVFYYCVILFIAFIHFKRPFMKKVISVAMILAVIVFLGVTKWQRTHRDELIITCLDVGHGQAILAQLPGKANILFDAGSLYSKDIGRRVVLPFLSYSGISRIDSIIISHNDVDHINGIPEIAKCCEVDGVYANNAFFNQADQWGTAKFLKESLSEKGLEIQPLGKEMNLYSNARVKIIWPNEQIDGLSDNDKSQVLLVEFAGKKILLCSDIEKFAQAELFNIYPDLKADVVVVPHHGSRRTTEPNFLENLDAEILICSCSRGDNEKNRIIKPTGNAKYFYTAEHGAVVVCIDKDGLVR